MVPKFRIVSYHHLDEYHFRKIYLILHSLRETFQELLKLITRILWSMDPLR